MDLQNMRKRDILEMADNVKPFAEDNGTKLVAFDELTAISVANIEDGFDMGIRTMNADGTIARSKTPFAAVNKDSYYINRCCKKKNQLYIVLAGNDCDIYRAIKEQSTGMLSMKLIPCYVFSRDDKKRLRYEKMVTITSEEFLEDFRDVATNETVQEIFDLLNKGITNDDNKISF